MLISTYKLRRKNEEEKQDTTTVLILSKIYDNYKITYNQPHSSVEKMHEYKEQRKTTTEITAAVTAVFVSSGML